MMMQRVTSQLQANTATSFDFTKIQWFRCQLSTWARIHRRDFPWRHTCDPYAILIAELLLQKTDAPTVAGIYKTFLLQYPTLEDLVKATAKELDALLKPLGLFFRVARLQQCAAIIQEQYAGKIPDAQEQLLKLPGIGLYTARSIGANAFGQPLAVLDTNVARILERFLACREIELNRAASYSGVPQKRLLLIKKLANGI